MSSITLTRPQLHALLAEFKQRFGQQYELTALGYFGSYARDGATATSDVDIVFDTNRPNLFATAMLKQDLEAFLGRPVDLIQIRGIRNQRLKRQIESEAVYV